MINSVAITLKEDCIQIFVVAIEPFYIAKILVDHRKLLCVYNFACINTFYIFGRSKEKKKIKDDELKLIKLENSIAN